jgi:hypothetical protein
MPSEHTRLRELFESSFSGLGRSEGPVGPAGVSLGTSSKEEEL